MNIFNFALWIILVALAGDGVGMGILGMAF